MNPGPAALQLVALDLRSLAVFRMALALCVLWDLLTLVPEASMWLTDAGVLPRAELFAIIAGRPDQGLPLGFATGSPLGQALIIAGAIAAGAAMLAGYRTRTATFFAWLLLSAIQLRNPFIVFGAGVFLRMLLFWGCFLPLGERWSVDRAQGGRASTPSGSATVIASPGTVGLYLQVAVVFVVAGLAKMANPVWRDGFGVAYSLDYEPLVTPFGQLLGSFPALCTLLTYVVVVLELAGPVALVLFARSAVVRMGVLAAMAAMLVGFALALRVGLFPWVSLAGLLAFLPSGFWDAMQNSMGKAAAAESSWFQERTTAHQRIAASTIAALAICYVLVWNAGLWLDAGYRAPQPLQAVGELLHLRQRWGMFTRLPSTGWLTIHGSLRDGTAVDLFAAGGPLPTYSEATALAVRSTARPPLVSATFKNVRWVTFFLSITEQPEQAVGQLTSYGRYLCREWNLRQADGKQLENFQLVYWRRPVEVVVRHHPTAEYRPVTLWDHNCFA